MCVCVCVGVGGGGGGGVVALCVFVGCGVGGWGGGGGGGGAIRIVPLILFGLLSFTLFYTSMFKLISNSLVVFPCTTFFCS